MMNPKVWKQTYFPISLFIPESYTMNLLSTTLIHTSKTKPFKFYWEAGVFFFSLSKESPYFWDYSDQIKVTATPSDYWIGSSANTHLSFSAQQAVIHPPGLEEWLILHRVQSQVLAYRSSQTISFLSVGGCTSDFMDPMGLVKFYDPATQQEE